MLWVSWDEEDDRVDVTMKRMKESVPRMTSSPSRVDTKADQKGDAWERECTLWWTDSRRRMRTMTQSRMEVR
jgi:hypothetical protein